MMSLKMISELIKVTAVFLMTTLASFSYAEIVDQIYCHDYISSNRLLRKIPFNPDLSIDRVELATLQNRGFLQYKQEEGVETIKEIEPDYDLKRNQSTTYRIHRENGMIRRIERNYQGYSENSYSAGSSHLVGEHEYKQLDIEFSQENERCIPTSVRYENRLFTTSGEYSKRKKGFSFELASCVKLNSLFQRHGLSETEVSEEVLAKMKMLLPQLAMSDRQDSFYSLDGYNVRLKGIHEMNDDEIKGHFITLLRDCREFPNFEAMVNDQDVRWLMQDLDPPIQRLRNATSRIH